MNAPSSFESFTLFDEEKKITIHRENKVPNAAVITIKKEDHTLGNLLRCQLLKDPFVLFAGYKQEHPLDHQIVIRIQTTPEYSPGDALKNAMMDLLAEMGTLEKGFKEAIEEYRERTGVLP